LTDDPVDHELQQLAGNRQLAEELKTNLKQLRDHGGDSPLAAMARDVLEGRLNLREVARSSAFAIPLAEAMDRFHDYDSQLSQEERARLIEEAEQRLADQDG
jgi:hypothetical protein